MDTSTNAQTVGEAMDRRADQAAQDDHVRRGSLASAGRFLRHFVLMVLVMNAGMMAYHALYATLLVPLGVDAALDPYPAIRHLLMEIAMVVPMVALMRYQRHSWTRNMEMAAAMMAGPLVFMACLQFNLHQFIPGLSAGVLGAAAEVSMYAGMLGVMLYRRNEHAHAAGPHAGHQHTGSAIPA